MYLKNGREIIESDRYPGYFIDQSNGAWCDEYGNYVGGNADDGDAPGRRPLLRRVKTRKRKFAL